MKLMLLFLAIFLSSFMNDDGGIRVSKPDGLEAQMNSKTAQKKHPDAMTKGYHILIFNGESKSKAEGVKLKFNAEYPEICDVVWDEPNFKVYVGNFNSKFECLKLYDQIKGKFQTTIIVYDKLPYQNLD